MNPFSFSIGHHPFNFTYLRAHFRIHPLFDVSDDKQAFVSAVSEVPPFGQGQVVEFRLDGDQIFPGLGEFSL